MKFMLVLILFLTSCSHISFTCNNEPKYLLGEFVQLKEPIEGCGEIGMISGSKLEETGCRLEYLISYDCNDDDLHFIYVYEEDLLPLDN